ncbi:MAG: hypothetical protein IKB11_00690 [Bacteroidaceae bacterium]|nr:hypothetical protein [Bacteroidaceae bacterium]
MFLAESEYKGKAKFWTTKHFPLFFSINFSSFFASVDFQAVRKQEKFHFFDEFFYRLAKRGIRNKKRSAQIARSPTDFVKKTIWTEYFRAVGP